MVVFQLRAYQSSDLSEIAQLFYQTVHTINRQDYSQAEVDAWADGQLDLAAWQQSLQAHQTIIAVLNGGGIVGFGDLSKAGYFDRLYVAANYQHQGIATAICDQLEGQFAGHQITTQASITARPFFTQRGYQVLQEQQVQRHGVSLTNFVMSKNLSGRLTNESSSSN
ncbi:MAG: GNAT family N-acetyltransferase [Lactobacillaceae bacterium]|jgi:putative acetyltransferase|nr:GNAT family N-acetyltransferase [Lactobacillaceae bacterium]